MKKVLVGILVVITLGCLIFATLYKTGVIKLNNDDKSPISEEQEELEKDGWLLLDLNKEGNFENPYKKLEISNSYQREGDRYKFNVVIENKIAYFEADGKRSPIKINNVKMVDLREKGCAEGDFLLTILTTEGNIYTISTEPKDSTVPEGKTLLEYLVSIVPKKMNSINKFESFSIYSVDIDSTCGLDYEIIGKTFEGNLYKVNEFGQYEFSEENPDFYKLNCYNCLEYYNELDSNKKIKTVGSDNIIVKYYFDTEDKLVVIDSNKDLYYLYSGDDGYTYEKVNKSPLERVLYKKDGENYLVNIIFDDGTSTNYTFNRVYSNLEKN